MTVAVNNVQVQVTYKGIDQTQRASKRARKAIRGVGAAGKGASRQLSGMRGIVGGLGGSLLKVAGPLAGIAGAFRAIGAAREAVRVSNEFGASMGRLATLLPGANDRLVQLSKNIRQIGVATGTDLNDVAAGAFQVVSAFGDAADTAEKLRVVTEAAAAGGSTVTDSLNLVSAVTKAYGDTSAGAVRHVADLAFQTNKLGQTTFPELAASMGKVTPLAAALGVKQEELFGVFATLTGVTGDASAVSTQLASAMGAMLKESTGASKAIKEMGFNSARAMIAELGLVGALKKITDHGGRSAEAIQELFTRKEAVIAVLPLIGSLSETAAEKIAAMGDSTNVMSEALRASQSGLGEQAARTKKLAQRSKEASIEIGDNLTGAVNDFTEAWIIMKEAASGKTFADFFRELKSLDRAFTNDYNRRNQRGRELAEQNAALLAHLRNLPEGFKGGLQGAFKAARDGISSLWATGETKARKAQKAIGDFAAKAATASAKFASDVAKKTWEKRRRRAVAAAKKRHALLLRQAEQFNDDLDRIRAADAQRAVDQRVAEGRALIEASDRSRQAQNAALSMLIDAELDDEKRAALERIQIEREAAAKITEINNDLYLDERTRTASITAIKASAAAQTAELDKRAADKRAANIADATRQLQTLQTQIGNTGSAVGNVLTALPALGAAVATSFTNSKTAMQDALSVGQSAFVGLADAEAKRSLAGIDNAHRLELATAKTEKERAAITEKFEARRAAAVESAERRKAAILAIMEAAKAIASYPNYPQMAAHGAAAALYAGIAGGVIGGGAAGGASVGAATGTGAAMATTTADAAPTTAAPVVVNFGAGFVFGTHQQVGKSVAGSLKSLRTTGLATAGGV